MAKLRKKVSCTFFYGSFQASLYANKMYTNYRLTNNKEKIQTSLGIIWEGGTSVFKIPNYLPIMRFTIYIICHNSSYQVCYSVVIEGRGEQQYAGRL